MRHHAILPALLLGLALPGRALAHHPTGGAAPASLLDGLLSGIGHPIIGVDHLAFVVAAGVLAAGLARPALRLGLPLLFLGCGTVGTLLHLAGLGLGPVEALIAASLLAAGALLLRGGGASAIVLGGLFAGAGLLHGHAFAEAVVGSEAGPILAYLLGLAGTQAAIAFAALALARRLAAIPARTLRRAAGAAACAVGSVAAVLAALG